MKLSISLQKLTGVRLALVAGLALATLARAATGSVSATLEPRRITLDEAAQLTVSVQGSEQAQPRLPEVDGLEFTPTGQSSSYQAINGTVTASESFLYQVTATKPGTYTIPAITAGTASSQPLQLQVVAGGNGGAGRPGAASGTTLPPPRLGSPADNDASAPATGQSAFLRVVAPKRDLYVGELVPVQIKAYFRRGLNASLNGLPVLSSDAFTMSKLPSQPGQSQEYVGGQMYTVVTWTTALSPVKAGEYALKLELPVMVRVSERPARSRNPFDSLFDDSFFEDFFGRVREKPLTLKADLAAIKVQSLPATDCPADFSGAVGRFDIRSEATPTSATVGEPITLKLTIDGTGNFDRVTTKGISGDANWKVYPPSMRFAPADSAGLEGTKTFEQAIVPRRAGELQIPAVAFSYFDPETHRYVTQHTKPIAMRVAAGDSSAASLAASTTPTAPTAAAAAPKPNVDAWQPNAVEPGRFVRSLQPLVLRPWYPWAVAAPLVLLGAGLWMARRRERALAVSGDRANEVALRESLDSLERASRTGAVTAFFIAARHALQERLAQIWQIPPHAVTLAEINARWQDAGSEIRAIFQAADQAAYAGAGFASVDLAHWRQVVLAQLKQMEKL